MKRIPTYAETGVGFAASYWAPVGTPVVPATYDAAGLTAAIAAAASGDGLVRLDADLPLAAGDVALTAGVSLYSTVGATIGGAGVLRPAGNQKIIGIRFAPTTFAIRLITAGTPSLTVACCEFTGGSQVILDSGASGTTMHTDGLMERNRFAGSFGYGFYLLRTARWKIRYNWMVGVSTTRHVFFAGGRDNFINYNYINTGLSGITHLSSLASTLGTTANTFQRQRVIGNTILNILEESVSFDVNGNSGANMGTIDQFVLDSTSGTAASSPKFIVPRPADLGNPNYLTRLYLMFITGALRGRLFAITANDEPTPGVTVGFTIANNAMTADEFASVTNTDVVTIGYPALDCFVENNYIESDGESGISLYGSCYNIKVRNNILSLPSGFCVRVTAVIGIGPSTSDSANRNTTTQRISTISAFNEVSNNLCLAGTVLCRDVPYATAASGNCVIPDDPLYNLFANNVTEDAIDIQVWKDSLGATIGGDISDPAALLTNSVDLTQISASGLPPTSTLLGAGTHIGNRLDRRGYQRPRLPSIGAFDAAVLRRPMT